MCRFFANYFIKDPVVIEGFDSRCDNEALRLVSQMPKWIPAMLDDIPISSYKVYPIVFWLNADGSSEESSNANTTD